MFTLPCPAKYYSNTPYAISSKLEIGNTFFQWFHCVCRQTDRLIDYLTDRLIDQLTDRLIDQLTDRLIDQLTDRLIDQLTDRLIHQLTDRLIMNWQIEHVIDLILSQLTWDGVIVGKGILVRNGGEEVDVG